MNTSPTHLSIVKSGPRTTIQDLGRRGSQSYGVSVSGVLDVDAAILGNRLVGNVISAAVLEITFGGAELRFDRDIKVAVTGAIAEVAILGVPQPMWTTLIVPASCTLQIGPATVGAHVYVSVAGGVNVPQVLGSRSTHLGTSMGGHHGRALADGDELICGAHHHELPVPRAGTTVPEVFDTGYVGATAPIRATEGAQYAAFSDSARDAFWGTPFRVSSVSDRQGSRLEGAEIRAIGGKHDIVSEAAYFGAVQIPSDGQPIVLLADRQSTGGYAKLASVIAADLGRVAQLPPGSEVQFERVDIESAQAIGRQRTTETRLAPLTEPQLVDERNFVCNAQDRRVAAIRAGESSVGDELWWVAADGSEESAVFLNHG